ncbi:Metallo-hydrolase/oxidoreductase, partial [Backusella circina FSU 941]
KVTCTPCQHFTGRGIFERNKTLWASWCVEGWIDGEISKGKVFFGGDTGYRAIPPSTKKDQEYDMEYLDTLPFCPVFKEIGDKIGPFDLALIPIGAYSPRWFMSPIHCSPEDSVRIHEDIKSKHSIGIHWGTFALTDEPIYEPPKRLESVLKQRGLKTEDFGVLSIGDTYTTTS